MPWDLAVVGAGVVGLLAAIRALESGYSVIVLERDRPGAGASTANAGVLHQVQPPPGKLRRTLAPRGARAWRGLLESLGVEPLEVPLIIAATSRLEEVLLPLASRAIRLLNPALHPQRLPGDRLRDLEPALSDRIRAGLLVEGYQVVHPPTLIGALTRRLEELGGALGRLEASRITCDSSHATVETREGQGIVARAVVNAAGEGALGLARPHGVRVKVTLHPGAMELYTRPRVRSIIARIPTSTKTKGGAVIPWPTGETLLGPTFSKTPTYNPKPGEVATRYKTLLAEPPAGFRGTIVGRRTVAHPRDFHITRPKACPRTVHLLGIESPGLTAAPILADLALEMLGLARGKH